MRPHRWKTFDLSAPFPHLAERALAEDFEQFKLRWVGFLAALFHMVGDGNLLVCLFILHKNSIGMRPPQALQVCRPAFTLPETIATYTV